MAVKKNVKKKLKILTIQCLFSNKSWKWQFLSNLMYKHLNYDIIIKEGKKKNLNLEILFK